MSRKFFQRVIISGLVLALLVLLVPGCGQAQPKQVLILVFEKSDDMNFMLVNEVGVMKDMLTKAGFKVVTASDSGQTLGSGDTALTPDLKIADVKLADYVGLMDPCVARNFEVDTSPATLALIKDAAAQGKVVAAQFGGVIDLYNAGVLAGKQYAFFDDPSENVKNAIYKGKGVVQDGNIITGGVCPYMARDSGEKDTTVELTQKFIDTLKAQ